jgi:hypothetical protein
MMEMSFFLALVVALGKNLGSTNATMDKIVQHGAVCSCCCY